MPGYPDRFAHMMLRILTTRLRLDLSEAFGLLKNKTYKRLRRIEWLRHHKTKTLRNNTSNLNPLALRARKVYHPMYNISANKWDMYILSTSILILPLLFIL
jgi:hypothetical protein